MNLSSAFSTLAKDAKTLVTVIGWIVAGLNEVLPVVPDQWKHWVTAAIAVGTVAARDLTDILGLSATTNVALRTKK